VPATATAASAGAARASVGIIWPMDPLNAPNLTLSLLTSLSAFAIARVNDGLTSPVMLTFSERELAINSPPSC
jgi:hypothetical protein